MAMLGSFSGMLRAGSFGTRVLRARLLSSLLEQKAGVCSVCASLARKAQQAQHKQQQQLFDNPASGRLHSLHRHGASGKQLLIPSSRLVQHTTSHFFRTTTHRRGEGAEWGYNGKFGADMWGEHYHDCNGAAQSPIDIVASERVKDNCLIPFTFRNFDTTDGISWTLLNNGHTAQVVTKGELAVSQGGLDSEYLVEQFHFHWGCNDNVGSEHKINGKSFPMEMHIVTYKSTYGNLTNAVRFSDGLAVLGVLFEITAAANDNYSNLIKALKSIQEPGSSTSVPPVALERLMPAKKDKYSRYSGSLTTPPCTEAVIWTLFRDYVSISSQQMHAFRNLTSADEDVNGNRLPLVNNFRPVQPLNKRQIRSNY